MSDLRPSELGPGLLVGEGVEIGRGVEFGGHVVVHAGARIGANCVLQDGAVVGKPVRLGPASRASRTEPGRVRLGEGTAILAGAVVFAGAEIGPAAVVGDQAQVRERTRIGRGSVIGRGSAVDNDVTVGERVKVQSNCYVTAYSELEDDVFVGPGAVLTNDDTMGRHARGAPLKGAVLKRACRVGGGAVLCPGVEIGEEAFVAAGAVVTDDVAAHAVVMGVPARRVRKVPDEDLIERWR